MQVAVYELFYTLLMVLLNLVKYLSADLNFKMSMICCFKLKNILVTVFKAI
jgi:hypothetical protein